MNLYRLSERLDNLIQFNSEAEALSWMKKAQKLKGAIKPSAPESWMEKARRLKLVRQSNVKSGY